MGITLPNLAHNHRSAPPFLRPRRSLPPPRLHSQHNLPFSVAAHFNLPQLWPISHIRFHAKPPKPRKFTIPLPNSLPSLRPLFRPLRRRFHHLHHIPRVPRQARKLHLLAQIHSRLLLPSPLHPISLPDYHSTDRRLFWYFHGVGL